MVDWVSLPRAAKCILFMRLILWSFSIWRHFHICSATVEQLLMNCVWTYTEHRLNMYLCMEIHIYTSHQLSKPKGTFHSQVSVSRKASWSLHNRMSELSVLWAHYSERSAVKGTVVGYCPPHTGFNHRVAWWLTLMESDLERKALISLSQ